MGGRVASSMTAGKMSPNRLPDMPISCFTIML